eukprot:146982-Rhodomonas_salina.1
MSASTPVPAAARRFPTSLSLPRSPLDHSCTPRAPSYRTIPPSSFPSPSEPNRHPLPGPLTRPGRGVDLGECMWWFRMAVGADLLFRMEAGVRVLPRGLAPCTDDSARDGLSAVRAHCCRPRLHAPLMLLEFD